MADQNFYFRDELEAERDRQAAMPTLAPAPAPAPAAPVAPIAPAAPKPAANPFPALGKAAAGAATPDYFADFRNAMDAENPFKQKAQQAVTQTLDNPFQGFDAGANAERDRLGREIGAEGERRRQAAALKYGGGAQADRAVDAFGNEAIMAQAELGRDLAAGRAQAGEAARSNAINQSLGLLGESRATAGQAAGIGLQQEAQRGDLEVRREGMGRDEAFRYAELSQRSAEGAAERGSRERVAFAGLAQEDRSLAMQAMQFTSRLEFEKSEAAAGRDQASIQRAWEAAEAEKQRTSQEKIAYAGLDLERDKFRAADQNAKQGLSLEANAQAMTRLGMDREEAYRYASLAQAKGLAEKGLSLEESAQALTAQGMKAEDARYYAGLAQEEQLAGLERQSREKLAFAQIGSVERLEASRQVFEATQKTLDRDLEKLMSNDRIAAQFQLADLDAKLQERMQASGFVQEREIETMRAQLQESLQAKGIDADTAKQIADHKFQEMLAGRDQAHEEAMTTLKQSWATGERIATQDWDKAMQATDQIQEEKMAKLGSLLRLEEQGNQQAFQTAFQEMQNVFTQARDRDGMAHETAMQYATQAFQERMQRDGFDHDTALQAARLAVEVSENQKSRASTEMMAAAQLAQSDQQFMRELQQRYQFDMEDLKLRRTELQGQMKLMGLQGQQLEQAIADSKVSSALDMVSLGMEMGDGSKESLAPFVEALGSTLETFFKGQGIDIAGSDFIKAMGATGGTSGVNDVVNTLTAGATTKKAFDDFDKIIDSTGGFASPEQADALKADLKTAASKIGGMPSGMSGINGMIPGRDYDAAANRLKAQGYTDAERNAMVRRRHEEGNLLGGSDTITYTGTPRFVTYTMFVKLLGSGLNKDAASAALRSLVGEEKANAAIAMERA